MDAKAPITQDVLTIPRKVPDGPQNLVGMSRDQMRDALIAMGTPEKQAKMRVGPSLRGRYTQVPVPDRWRP